MSPVANQTITDEALLTQLRHSGLKPMDQYRFTELVPHMNQGERERLSDMIAHSNKVSILEEKDALRYQKGVRELNAEAKKNMANLSREFQKKASIQKERSEKNHSSEALKALEDEMKNL